MKGLESPSPAARVKALRKAWATARRALFEADNIMTDAVPAPIEEVVDALLPAGALAVAAIGDEAGELREAACQMFGPLARIAWSDDYIVDDDRKAGLRALVERAVPRLLAAASDEIESVRAEAITALVNVPRAGDCDETTDGDESPPLAADPAELDLLRRALRDPSPAVRASAIRGLVHRIGRAAEPDLIPLVDDHARIVEDQLIESLGRFESRIVLPVIVRRVRADPEDFTRTFYSDGSEASTALIDWLNAYALDPHDARELLLPLLSRGMSEFRRADVVRGLVEHVDGSCRDALAKLVPAGDLASEYALIALARLGAEAPIDTLAYWLDPDRELPDPLGARLVERSGIALAASGCTDHLGLLLRRLARTAHSVPFGVVHKQPRAVSLLRVASMFDHPSLHAAAAAFLPGASEGNTRYACLALGSANDRAGIPLLRAALATKNVETRLYVQLALALIDPEAVTAIPDGWRHRVETNEEEFLVLAFALRLLGRRLATRTSPLPDQARMLVDSALGWIENLDLDESLQCQRGRGGFHGVGFAWVFLLRDVLAEARRGLQAVRDHGR